MALLLLLAPVAALTANAGCSVAPAAIVGWWPGDGNANDIAGTNHGTLQGGATANAGGFVNSAFSFDGTNSYIQIPDSLALRPTNLTVEAWVRFSSLDSAGNSPAGQQYIVFKQNSRSSSFEGYNLAKVRVTGGDVLAFIVSSAVGQVVQVQSTTLVTTGAWYHVAGVRGSNFTQLYVNGQLESQTNVSFPQDYGNYPLLLGSSGQSYWDRKLKGSLDEVSLYNRALSSTELAAIYSAGAAGKCNAGSAPSITTQPKSQSVVAGSNAVFTIAAAGGAPLHYQWQFNSADLSGATSTSLILTGVQPTNGGSYTVVVTNSVASATSAVAVLAVLVPPAISAPLQSRTNLTGTLAGFSATATGSAPLAYQWQLNGLNLANGGRISGATSNALAIAGVQAADAGSYTLVVSNFAGIATSAVAALTIISPPVITLQPDSQSVVAGSGVAFSVTVSGTPPLSYQWRKNGVGLANDGNLSGATSAGLTLANAQTNDAGSYQVVIANSVGSVTSVVANLTVDPPFQGFSQSAGAVVLVNSQSARYPDFQHFIQPYLDNFGFPYTVQDIATNAPGQSISNYAVIIIGHSQLDTNRSYLNPTAQVNLSLAVSNGTGLVSFDNDLQSGGSARYQFAQDIFGFNYGAGASGTNASLPSTEPSSKMHFITARHPANDLVPFRSSLSLPGITVPVSATTLATVGGRPLVAVTKYGQGRAVQWGSYDWMVSTVLGPVDGLDDVVWRGVVWAARKPFVMRGLPNFVTMRVDDVSGPFDWVHAAIAVGFKPFLALFYQNLSEASAADLRAMTTNGQATASIHSTGSTSSFFYFNHATEQPWPDNVQSNYFYLGTQWHVSHDIPISKVCATHFSEIGVNCFAGLKAWGMEFVPIEVVPGTVEYATPGAPWVVNGPYRLYETPQPGQVNWPTYYADWLTVPGHPEFNGQFFNIYSEVRDASSSCHEWCPDNDVAGSITRATRIAKRTLDSMVMTTIYTHEPQYISLVSAANWQAILQGITNGLASYQPSYVTLDYASQYVRATRTSRLVSGAFDADSGLVKASFSGKTDLDTQVYVFVGADSGISSTLGKVPAFSGPVTNTVATLEPRQLSPAIVSGPASLTTNAGATVVFSLTAAGTAPLSYQWLLNLTPLTSGGNISGATTPVLNLAGVTSANAGDYRVVITNAVGSVTSSVVALMVVTVPQFTSITPLPDQSISLWLPAVSNLACRIDASTDLSHWAEVTNFPNPSGMIQFIDLEATNFSRRFYRAVWAP